MYKNGDDDDDEKEDEDDDSCWRIKWVVGKVLRTEPGSQEVPMSTFANRGTRARLGQMQRNWDHHPGPVSCTHKGQGDGERPQVLRSQARLKLDLASGDKGKSGLLPKTMLTATPPPTHTHRAGLVNPTFTKQVPRSEPYESPVLGNKRYHVKSVTQETRPFCKVRHARGGDSTPCDVSCGSTSACV